MSANCTDVHTVVINTETLLYTVAAATNRGNADKNDKLDKQILQKLHLHCSLDDFANTEEVQVLTIVIYPPMFSPMRLSTETIRIGCPASLLLTGDEPPF